MQIDIFVAADAEVLEKEVDARGRHVLPGEIVVAKFLDDAGLEGKSLNFNHQEDGRDRSRRKNRYY